MTRRSMSLLLLEDVNVLGRSGEVVNVKPGYARNFLIPKQKAVFADKQTLRLQEELKKKRLALAAKDKTESAALAKHLEGQTFALERKVDEDGHMYGSVSVNDLVELLAKTGFELDKHVIALPHPIKKLGVHTINVNLKEGVTCAFIIKVLPEGGEDLIDLTADKVKKRKKEIQEPESEGLSLEELTD